MDDHQANPTKERRKPGEKTDQQRYRKKRKESENERFQQQHARCMGWGNSGGSIKGVKIPPQENRLTQDNQSQCHPKDRQGTQIDSHTIGIPIRAGLLQKKAIRTGTFPLFLVKALLSDAVHARCRARL